MNEQPVAPEGHEITQPGIPEAEPSEPENGHRRELTRGIGIFVGLNTLLLVANQIFVESDFGIFIGWIAMVVNIIVLAYFARYRKGVAGGILGAFTCLLVLTFIVAPVFWFTVCFYNMIEHWH